MEARKGGEGGIAVRGCSAAAMAWAAAFRGAGSGGELGLGWNGEVRGGNARWRSKMGRRGLQRGARQGRS